METSKFKAAYVALICTNESLHSFTLIHMFKHYPPEFIGLGIGFVSIKLINFLVESKICPIKYTKTKTGLRYASWIVSFIIVLLLSLFAGEDFQLRPISNIALFVVVFGLTFGLFEYILHVISKIVETKRGKKKQLGQK